MAMFKTRDLIDGSRDEYLTLEITMFIIHPVTALLRSLESTNFSRTQKILDRTVHSEHEVRISKQDDGAC